MTVRILTGDNRDVLKTLPDASIHCCVTSPPYFGLRDYGMGTQIGLEATPDAFVAELVAVFREVRRVLRDDGTLWLNLGDSYSGSGKGGGGSFAADGMTQSAGTPRFSGLKAKNLIGIPWRVAFALQADGWVLRQDIIWSKLNPMPESVTDRCTKAHEYLFLLSKSPTYYCDMKAIAEPIAEASKSEPPISRNKRSVWEVATQPYSEAHFATFPPALIVDCIKAGCPAGGTVLDPFGGAGTTGLVADRLQRSAVLIELNPDYVAIATKRIHGDAPLFAEMEIA